MDFTENNGIFTAIDNRIRYVIVNCSLNPKHKYAKGNNIFLYVGKADSCPIGDFWSVEKAKEAAENLRNLIEQLLP